MVKIKIKHSFKFSLFKKCFRNQAVSHLRKALEKYNLQLIDSNTQTRSYCGNIQELLSYMKENNKKKMKPGEIHRWLKKHPEHIPETLRHKQFEIDHIVAASFGGPDHPYNYFIMPKEVNNHFREYMTPAKLAYIGKKNAAKAKAFVQWFKSQAQRFIDPNEFDQQINMV